MNKDVIYIDVEDDITAIIGKIKDSKEKIVALVPPKRVGVLQSAVNLRLLDRMANTANKRLVLITNNQALIGLSASAGIPVAKNLQSKPELAEISALEIDDGEDVIDGEQLSVGELEKTSDSPVKSSGYRPSGSKEAAIDDTVGSMEIDNLDVPLAGAAIGKAATSKVVKNAKAKSKVPNFDRFRRRLFIVIAAVIVLVGFLIWANVFAPAATIIITARTTSEGVSLPVTVADNATTSLSASTIQSVTKSVPKTATVTFTPTGQKDIGAQAVYTIKLSKLSQTPTDVPAGTNLTATDGLVFVTQSDATIPASVACFPNFCAQSTTVPATAEKPGTNYNGETGSLDAPNGVSATFGAQTTTGSSNVVTVVTSDDIAKATAQLASTTTSASTSSNTVKTQLQKEFNSSQIVISDSFANTTAAPVSSPALNAQASGTATLTATTTYTLSAVSKADVENFLKSSINSQIGTTKNQRIYDDGISKVSFNDFTAGQGSNTMTIVATGQAGPSIDETAVKKQAEGQIYGTVQSNLQAINGVDTVDIKFSYFWVTKVPNDPNKIKIEFQINNND
jgi:hypothetical protein